MLYNVTMVIRLAAVWQVLHYLVYYLTADCTLRIVIIRLSASFTLPVISKLFNKPQFSDH